jgi:two-component sensor histidine kinase/CHASE1-domain containing sensor protein
LKELQSAHRDFRRWLVRFPRAVPVAIFLLTLAITALSVFAIERVETQRSHTMLRQEVLSIASAIERRVNATSAYLRAGAALFTTLDQVREPVFRHFVSELHLNTDYQGAEEIGWAPRIEPSKISSYEQKLAEGYGNEARLYPPLARGQAFAVPVTYLQPLPARNSSAIGFDMYSDPVRRTAMVQAMREARPTASGKVLLVQEGVKRSPGFLIYMPVFENKAGVRSLKGFIYSPFNAQEFVKSVARLLDPEEFGVSLYDEAVAPRNLLARIAPETRGGPTVTMRVPVADHDWILVVDKAARHSLSTLSQLTLLFGLLVASLLMVLARLLTQQALEDRATTVWLEEQNSIRNSLTRELNHRVKNTLANVLSLVTLTRRKADDIDSFADSLSGRIRALSATHDLLTRSDWAATPIGSLIEAELVPYTQDGERTVEMAGPLVELAPNDALSLGLAIHELATNAVKYGALSAAEGTVKIDWELRPDGRATVHWREIGGPPVSPERQRGFGTELIEKIVAHELGNPVDLRFEPEGVQCTLIIPVREPREFLMREKNRKQ